MKGFLHTYCAATRSRVPCFGSCRIFSLNDMGWVGSSNERVLFGVYPGPIGGSTGFRDRWVHGSVKKTRNDTTKNGQRNVGFVSMAPNKKFKETEEGTGDELLHSSMQWRQR